MKIQAIGKNNLKKKKAWKKSGWQNNPTGINYDSSIGALNGATRSPSLKIFSSSLHAQVDR